MIFSAPSPPSGPLRQYFASLIEAIRRALLPLISRDEATPRVLFLSADGTSYTVGVDNSGQATVANTLTGANVPQGLQEVRGAWTPALKFGGNSVGMTYTTQQGRYLKIGKQVTVWGWFQLSAKGSSTGIATITGLPFPAANNGVTFYSGMVPYTSFAATNNLGLGISAGSASAINTYNGNANMTDALFAASSSMMFSVTYETSA